jgi:hypothetical protein
MASTIATTIRTKAIMGLRHEGVAFEYEVVLHQVTLSVLPVRSAQSGGSFSPRVSTQAVAIPQASNAATISRNINMRLSPSDLEPTMVSYRL